MYISNLLSYCRLASSQVQPVRQGFQTQTPSDRAPAPPLRREAIPVSQVSQAILPQRLLQSAHKPQVGE